MFTIPPRYKKAIEKLQSLEKIKGCESVLIFGSFARGETTDKSDLDVRVMVEDGETCKSVNHPIVDGVKIDISFATFDEFKKWTNDELSQKERIPLVTECVILFDKTGRLTNMQNEVGNPLPKKADKKEIQWIQFMIYHADDKAKRNIKDDPYTALLCMDIGINDILKMHYQIQGKWWVSSKRLLKDLRRDEPVLAQLLEKFVSTVEVEKKYSIWEEIIEYVLKPVGGRQSISENNCDCEICQKHLKNFV